MHIFDFESFVLSQRTNDFRRCANPIGQICGYWSGWTPFGACSTSCGRGVAIRRRSCNGGNVGDVGKKKLFVGHER